MKPPTFPQLAAALDGLAARADAADAQLIAAADFHVVNNGNVAAWYDAVGRPGLPLLIEELGDAFRTAPRAVRELAVRSLFVLNNRQVHARATRAAAAAKTPEEAQRLVAWIAARELTAPPSCNPHKP